MVILHNIHCHVCNKADTVGIGVSIRTALGIDTITVCPACVGKMSAVLLAASRVKVHEAITRLESVSAGLSAAQPAVIEELKKIFGPPDSLTEEDKQLLAELEQPS